MPQINGGEYSGETRTGKCVGIVEKFRGKLLVDGMLCVRCRVSQLGKPVWEAREYGLQPGDEEVKVANGLPVKILPLLPSLNILKPFHDPFRLGFWSRSLSHVVSVGSSSGPWRRKSPLLRQL